MQGSHLASTDASGMDAASANAHVRDLEGVSAAEQAERRDRLRAARIGVQSGDRVLDLGCGIGTSSVALASRVGPDGFVLAVDRSRIMIERARQRTEQQRLSVGFAIGEAEALAVADRSFDLCWVKRLLAHVPAPERALSEIFRVLRPGGRIVLEELDYAALILDPAEPAITGQVIERIARYYANPRLARGLRRMVSAAGFAELRLTTALWDLGRLAEVDRRLHLSGRTAELIDEGAIPPAAGHAWLSALHSADRVGRFTCCLPGFALVASRP